MYLKNTLLRFAHIFNELTHCTSLADGSINFVKRAKNRFELNTAKSACNNFKFPFFDFNP